VPETHTAFPPVEYVNVGLTKPFVFSAPYDEMPFNEAISVDLFWPRGVAHGNDKENKGSRMFCIATKRRRNANQEVSGSVTELLVLIGEVRLAQRAQVLSLERRTLSLREN
jgi:hypothetical protein